MAFFGLSSVTNILSTTALVGFAGGILGSSASNWYNERKKNHKIYDFAENGQADKITENELNLNELDLFQKTPLMYACKNGHINVVDKLLSFDDIDPNIQNFQGYTALMYAAEYNYHSIILKLLIDDRINVNLKNSNGHTALMIAIKHNCDNVLIKNLIDHIYTDINLEDRNGWTALFWSIYTNNIVIVRYLLNNTNININHQDLWGDTPLIHSTANYQNYNITLCILQGKHININIKNKKGFHAKHIILEIWEDPTERHNLICILDYVENRKFTMNNSDE